MPNLSDIYPAGASGQTRIKAVEKDRIVLEQRALDGSPFIVTTHRQVAP
ncbi:hypothetical protein [Pseudomonas corrugata]